MQFEPQSGQDMLRLVRQEQLQDLINFKMLSAHALTVIINW